jgi:IclR helix-turn-helix domain
MVRREGRLDYRCVVAKALASPPAEVPSWTFLTNHAHVLVCIAQDSEIRLAEIARRVGIGERAVHGIVQDLVDAGYVLRAKQGRHNVYAVRMDRNLRHPLEAGHRLTEVFGPLVRND